MNDMIDFGLWAQGSRTNEQLRVMDDLNDSVSYQFRHLDDVNHLRFWMTLTSPGCELSAIDTMNTLGLWLTWITLGRKLKALDTMTESGVWMRWTTLGCELKA